MIRLTFLKLIKEKIFFFLLGLGFIIRLILMPISTHSDLFSLNFYPPLLIENGIWDVYSYLEEKSPKLFYYPPLTYYIFAAFQFSYTFFSDSFIPWMNELRSLNEEGFKGQAPDYIIKTNNSNIFKDLFLAKVPYLLFDILAVVVLLNFAKRKIINSKNVIIWILNPILIYNAYIFGHFDIIPIFFILLAFYFLSKNKYYLSIFILVIAAAYKIYPLLFALPIIMVYGKSPKEYFKLGIILSLPFIISLSPTLISDPKIAIFAFTKKLFNFYHKNLSEWEIYSNAFKYSLIIFSYFLLLIFCKFSKLKNRWYLCVGTGLITVLLLLTLVYRAHFHYLIWTAPFLVLWFKQTKKLVLLILILSLSYASYKTLAYQLQLGLFSPLNPEFFSNLPTFNEMIDKIIPYRIISTLGFLIFSILSLYIIGNVLVEIIFRSKVKIKLANQGLRLARR